MLEWREAFFMLHPPEILSTWRNLDSSFSRYVRSSIRCWSSERGVRVTTDDWDEYRLEGSRSLPAAVPQCVRLVSNELLLPRPELSPLPAKLEGLDSRGRPKHAYLKRIGQMPNAEPIEDATGRSPPRCKSAL